MEDPIPESRKSLIKSFISSTASNKVDDPSQGWDPEVWRQVPSAVWLMKNGLKANNLDSTSIYPQLGFLHREEFDRLLKQPPGSKHSERHLSKQIRDMAPRRATLLQLQKRLQNAVTMFQHRLDWLTCASRRMFGVIMERVVTIVIDLKTASSREFDQCVCLVERLIREQVKNLAQFNLIRCAEDLPAYDFSVVPVTKDSVELAIDWLWNLDRFASTASSNTIEALLKASMDKANEAIYLFSEGKSSDHSREVLSEQIKRMKVPLHVVLYNCEDLDWMRYLQRLCLFTNGRFHAYSTNSSQETNEFSIDDQETSRAIVNQLQGSTSSMNNNIVVNKPLYGPPTLTAGTREDYLLIQREMELTRHLLDQINFLVQQLPEPKSEYENQVLHQAMVIHERQEEAMSSNEWLQRYGLKPRRLEFYDALKNVVSRDCEAVVIHPPNTDDRPENWDKDLHELREPKLLKAKHCDRFAHVRWKDGVLVHVQVTSELYRAYEQKMQVALGAFQRRIDWLKQGSRELFGTLMEDQVYILVETSSSMGPHMMALKDKLYALLHDQLKHKRLINFITFNNKAHPWKQVLVEATDTNIEKAWQWLKTQRASGTANMMAALKFALNDPNAQGIYLLSHSTPDQSYKVVIGQLQFHHKIPVHTISYVCPDRAINDFLHQLAQETGGRYQCFQDTELDSGKDSEENPLNNMKSDDVDLLEREIDAGMEYLERVSKLRDECFRLAWNKSAHDEERIDFESLKLSPQHMSSRSSSRRSKKHKAPRQSSLNEEQNDEDDTNKDSPRKRMAPVARNTLRKEIERHHNDPNHLHLCEGRGSSKTEEWLMPETKALLDDQEKRYEATFKDGEHHCDCSHSEHHSHNKGNVHADEGDDETNDVTEKGVKKKNKSALLQWIRDNTLRKKHLTIYDALEKHIIPQRSVYVDILDKHVSSLVFDNIMPIRYYRRDKTLLINPLSVDWRKYRNSLTNILLEYEKMWRKLVRNVIDADRISELITAAPSNINFAKHYRIIDEEMEYMGWPIDEIAWTQLCNEMRKGWHYYQESIQLEKFRSTALENKSEIVPDKNSTLSSSNKTKSRSVVALSDKRQATTVSDMKKFESGVFPPLK